MPTSMMLLKMMVRTAQPAAAERGHLKAVEKLLRIKFMIIDRAECRMCVK
jgi:hypothetical protein